MKANTHDLGAICFLFAGLIVLNFIREMSLWILIPSSLLFGCALAGAGLLYYEYLSKNARDRKKRIETINALPKSLVSQNDQSVEMGRELDLQVKVSLPDIIRSRHVHILGATGSGKTESVILNFLKQDVVRGLGSIILDAKGDMSFLATLRECVPTKRLQVFDLGDENSLSYDPLSTGTPLEAAQRLFSSLTWSEEYYKSKALSALQRIFQTYYGNKKRNPTLAQISRYLDDQGAFVEITANDFYPKKNAEKDFSELSGLRDQVKMLCLGHLAKILSPNDAGQINLSQASSGQVIYFRLQSLMSPQLVGTVGKLLINHLNYLAGSAHRAGTDQKSLKLVPVYLDEFATFACPEFADLISKARSAGFALHFSHQSVGDLVSVSDGFLNQITDNSATKIILRINDPDSAEFFARTFGTAIYQKVTRRISNVEDPDLAEIQGEGTQRDAHQFRASPDLFKNHPTGVGSVLISHGFETPSGASSVFRIQFPRLSIGN